MADVGSNDSGRSEDKSRDPDQMADSRPQDQRPKSPVVQARMATSLVDVSAEVAH